MRSKVAQGEIVVTNGNFKIDSAMQIQAKPSMMNPDTRAAPTHHHGADSKAEPLTRVAAEQTACPVMGGPINKDIFTMYKAEKLYFCCPGCKPEFEKNPLKYLAKLPQFKK